MRQSHSYRSFLGMILIRLQGTWPEADPRRGVNVGGRMFALQQMVCEVFFGAHALMQVWFL